MESNVKIATFDPNAYTEEAREVWNIASRHYDEKIASRFFGQLANATAEWAGIQPGERVLDVACGSGIATLEAARLAGKPGRVTAVDLSPAMIQLAKEKAQAIGFRHIEFKEMNAEAMEFGGSSFDVAICQLGLMLFADARAALKETLRVLTPGGRAVWTVQGTAEKMVFTGAIQKAIIKRAPHLKVPGAPTMYTFGPEGALENALKEAGFARVESRRMEGAFPFDSFEDYWTTVTSGAGKTKMMIESLSAADQKGILQEVREFAQTFRKNGKFEIPYEFVLAKGFKK